MKVSENISPGTSHMESVGKVYIFLVGDLPSYAIASSSKALDFNLGIVDIPKEYMFKSGITCSSTRVPLSF